jgi:hypothetical protein
MCNEIIRQWRQTIQEARAEAISRRNPLQAITVASQFFRN